jgi:signal transduction histidine kinase
VKLWWRERSLRARLMIIGVTGLAIGFLVGGAALVEELGVVLQRSVDSQIDVTAHQVATLVDTNALPVPIAVPAGDQVQVIDAKSRVRAASSDADPLVPMVSATDLQRLRDGQRFTVYSGPSSVENGPFRVVAVVAGPPDDPQLVVVARSMADVGRGLGLLRSHLLVLFPLLLLASAVVAWHVIGASLRPVEQLRRGAEEITGSGPVAASRLPLPSARDEIHRLAVTLNGMLDRLESGRARQREFVADAAHELRSPLANMRTQLEVARRLGPAADWPAVGDDLLTDTDRLARLVDDLLLLARSDAAPPASRLEPVELNALLHEVADRPHEPGVVRVTVAGNGCVWTPGVPDELRRVVGNLVDNAVRHARTGVEIATIREGDRALLTVTDDGPGIPAADRARVFERFTRLDDSRALDTGGAGLGLAIVRELVRRHGGTVALTDASDDIDADGCGPGLRVEVRLPAIEPA